MSTTVNKNQIAIANTNAVNVTVETTPSWTDATPTTYLIIKSSRNTFLSIDGARDSLTGESHQTNRYPR
jgi:hypothetical protein